VHHFIINLTQILDLSVNYAQSRGSTGNLRRYLQSIHPEKWKKESNIGPMDYFLGDDKYLVSLSVFYYYIYISLLLTFVLALYSQEFSGKTYPLDSL